jgi:hypothetical protein
LGVLFLSVVVYALGDTGVSVLSVIFVVLPAIAWFCAGILWVAHRHVPEARNLGERAVVAVRDAIVATIGGVLGLSRLADLDVPNDVAVGLLVGGMLLVAAYPLAWLIQWQQGRWD